ncbi:MAG: dihydrolipoyl dehydrogenase [Spongiibacteraceae bacterium]|jgi:dihydrolipoamide dehydrogenase|nr:dihydrolipoyl dehydrogenase [Spongiibacteraceae bacterium]
MTRPKAKRDKQEVDVVVIGAGTAGLNAVAEVRRSHRSWVLVESGPYGTTCARVGCMPSKLLIAAADRAHQVATAGEFGISAGPVSVDAQALFSRLRAERDRFVAGAVKSTTRLPDEQRLQGRARLTGPTTVLVERDGQSDIEINARAIVAAVGSSPNIPQPFRDIMDHVWTSDEVFELDALPESLAVIGTGAIGLELGQALSRLGVNVSFFSTGSAIGPLRDPALQQCVQQVFQDSPAGDAMAWHLDMHIQRARLSDSRAIALEWQDARGEMHQQQFSNVLLAAGRRPQLAGLDLEKAGVVLNERGLPADWDPRTTRCGDTAVFIVGDASHYRPVLHEAADEGRAAGQNAAAYPQVTALVRRTPMAIVFSHPQMASVGARFSELNKDGIEIGTVSYGDQGRARVQNENAGKVNLYAERGSCMLLGAELFCPSAEHLAHLLAWAIQQRLRVDELLSMPFYHPVLEEGLRTALRDLSKALRIEGSCRSLDFAESAGT